MPFQNEYTRLRKNRYVPLKMRAGYSCAIAQELKQDSRQCFSLRFLESLACSFPGASCVCSMAHPKSVIPARFKAGIQANPDWTPDKAFGGDAVRGCSVSIRYPAVCGGVFHSYPGERFLAEFIPSVTEGLGMTSKYGSCYSNPRNAQGKLRKRSFPE